MTALSIQPPFPIVTDIDGQPLEDGYIWIGTAGLNPIGNPINVYWDAALSVPVALPVRTRGGYPMRSGTPARLYVDSDYSLLVQNKNGSTVYSALTATERLSGVVVEVDSTDVSFIQAGTGAVTRTAQAKMRDVVDARDYGIVGDGVTDETAKIQAILNDHENVYFPLSASAYLITSINIPAGRTILTESIAVKFQQKSGQPAGTRVFTVMGSNVTIGDMTIQGNIATDTAEFNHAIAVASTWSGVVLSNVSIGNIKAINIRGDGVYIGQTVANGTVSNVRVESVEGSNVLRNVVSIVGGFDIDIGQVFGSAVGYMHVDIEPDGVATGNCFNVRVGQVKGRHIGIVLNNPTSATFNENIRFDEVNLDPAFATQSTPAYSGGASIADRAVWLRSLRSGFIGSLKVNGFNGSAIWRTAGGVDIESLFIDQCIITDCAKTDAVYYSYVECPNITFGYLRAVTQSAAAAQKVIGGSGNCVVLSGNFVLGNNASVVRSAPNCVLQNCAISGASATGTYVAIDANNLKISHCTISNVDRLAGFMNNLQVENTTATLSVAVLNTVTKVVYVKSTIQSQYYPFAIVDRTHTECMVIGGYFLWVDSTGDLRIKLGAPTSDTDGTVVGTQT